MTVVAHMSHEVETWFWCSYSLYSHIFHGS